MPPNSPKNPQWNVRLDRYHRFVVERLQDIRETDRSAILEQMIVAWVSDHMDLVAMAGASPDEWRRVRAERQDEDDEEN